MARNLAGQLARGIGVLGVTWALGVVAVSADPPTFSVKSYPVGGVPYELVSGDFNGDGVQDLAALVTPTYLSFFFGDGAGNFSAGPKIQMDFPASLAVPLVGDFDEDGRDEVAILNGGPIRFFHINTDGTSGPVTEFNSPIFPFISASLAVVADFDLDGHLDLVLASGDYERHGSLTFLSGDGHDQFGAPIFTDLPASPKALTVGDVDRDGLPDIVVASNSPPTVDFMLGRGDGTFARGLRSFYYQDSDFFNGRASSIGLADMNRDGRQDVAVTLNIDQSRTDSYIQREGGFFNRGGTGRGTDRLDLGDFNNDGFVDVAVTDYAGSVLWVNLTGSSPFDPYVTFTDSLPFPAGLQPRPLVGGDFDSDGRRDLAVATWNSPEILVFLNQGPPADADHDGLPDAEDPCTDTDGDGFGDPGFPASICSADNCAHVANPTQTDADGDGVGDACDDCPGISDPGQADADRDGIGDACDGCTDTDRDGFGNHGFPANTCAVDNCDYRSNPAQADADLDGVGNVCDPCTDTDGDGYADLWLYPVTTCGPDNCTNLYNPDQADADGDYIGDACDPCPFDSINDGDHDGRCSDVDNCPVVPNADQADGDGDGVGNACDNCVAVPNADQADENSDGSGDACQPHLSLLGTASDGVDLEVAVKAGDPNGDPLIGTVDIVGYPRRTVRDLVAAGSCAEAFLPEGNPGMGIAYVFGSLGTPVLFDLDYGSSLLGVPCGGDGQPDYDIWMGSCDDPRAV
ncbi:MAG TPA: FG-GAP-like repeat-containing protein, partial [Candidatus Polarisedimenticolia bacterium]|nr:FG-GAP-like repeat-containing protein [Candidatus Polarisedimenticolia bacterium]